MNEIMTSETSGFSWGWIIFLILILWFFVGGGFGGFGGYGRGANAFLAGDITGQLLNNQHGASNCEVERRQIIDSATTNYRIIDQAQQTRDLAEALTATTNNKIDSYAYEQLKDKLTESQRENMMLQNKLYSDAKFNAVEAQLATISAKMAKQPEIYAASAVCPNAGVINGLGVNGFPFPYPYGFNGNVLS